jgi:hypothetical protein
MNLLVPWLLAAASALVALAWARRRGPARTA